jgi:molecular chaperone GrpE
MPKGDERLKPRASEKNSKPEEDIIGKYMKVLGDGQGSKVKELTEANRKLEKDLSDSLKKLEEVQSRLRYLQAEFDNYRKYVEKDKRDSVKLANEPLMKDLLVVLDEFDKAIEVINDKDTREGVELLYKNFLKVMQKHGLEGIDCLGKKFDPYLNEVVLAQDSDKEEGTVLNEVQKGYRLNSKVIRYSKVVVSKDKGEGCSPEEEVEKEEAEKEEKAKASAKKK